MTTRTYNLSSFSLAEMAECAAAIRRCGTDALSMEEAADAITTFLRRRLVDDEGEPAAVLVRVFATAPVAELEPRTRLLAEQAAPAVTDTTECLTLLATSGSVGRWNDRRASQDHQVIPFTDAEAVSGMPMVSALLTALGVDIDSVVHGRAIQVKETFGVFHVSQASGSEMIPAQGFVREHGVESAVGFGGVLPSGRVFAVVLFSREQIGVETAELFGPIGVSVRLALLPFDSGAVFSGQRPGGPGPRDVRAESIAYAQLLDAFESTATAQAARLERALDNAREHQERVEAEVRLVETLHYVGSSLAGQLDLDEIIDVATEAATAVTGAQFGAFFLNNLGEGTGAEDSSYVLHAVAGQAKDQLDGFPMPHNTAVFEPTFRGDAIFRSSDISEDARLGSRPPYGDIPPRDLPARSFLAVPVVSRSGGVVGAILLAHQRADVFDERDERLAAGIAGQASTAIDTARLYGDERRARRAAERTARQLGRLQASTAGLGTAHTVGELAQIIVTEGSAGLEASGATLFLRRGRSLVATATHGHEAAGVDPWRTVDLREGLPLTDAIASNDPIFLSDRSELASRYPQLARQPNASAAHAVLPFATDGGEEGAIVFTWAASRPFSSEDRQFMLALSSQCSQAIDRAKLAEAERANARRQQFLSEASRQLAGTLDTEETIQTAVRLCVGELAASATVHLLADGDLHMRAAAASDPDLDDHLGRVLADEPIRTADRRIIRVVEGHGPVRMERLDDLDLVTGIDRSWAITGEAPVAGAAVPLEARTVCFGVLAITRDHPYDDGDLALLQDLAGRIAVSIDNARLHEDRSETAILLQRSLLPPHLPGIPGMEVDVRYRALARGSDLGGDFYDVFRIAPGRWGAIIGDVCGKGIAAASLTALARFTARAAALSGASVTEVLGVVNRAVLDEGVEDRFCTMIAMVIEPEHDDGAHVRMAVGGHPLPMVISPHGAPRPAGAAGMVVGLFDEPEWTESETVLRPFESLVLYTDGVTEARSPSGDFAPELLTDILAKIGPVSATSIVEQIEHEVLAFGHGEQRDDMAILAIRSVGAGSKGRTSPQEFDRRFPPIAASVSMARQEVSSWLSLSGHDIDRVADEVLLVVTELATNAMRAARTGFHLRLWLEGAAVVLELADDGPGFDEASVSTNGAEPELMAERGRGLFLLRELMDDTTVESNSSGTVVRARKRYRPD